MPAAVIFAAAVVVEVFVVEYSGMSVAVATLSVAVATVAADLVVMLAAD